MHHWRCINSGTFVCNIHKNSSILHNFSLNMFYGSHKKSPQVVSPEISDTWYSFILQSQAMPKGEGFCVPIQWMLSSVTGYFMPCLPSKWQQCHQVPRGDLVFLVAYPECNPQINCSTDEEILFTRQWNPFETAEVSREFFQKIALYELEGIMLS